jgi:hypothetical protein
MTPSADNQHSVKLETVAVDDCFESNGPRFFETKSEYGYQVPKELWDRYEAACAVVAELDEQIFKCEFKAHPPPKPGTLAYGLWSMYRDLVAEQVEWSNRIFMRAPSQLPSVGEPSSAVGSRDDGTVRRLERLLRGSAPHDEDQERQPS